jgi:hypothetical protein
VQPIDMVAIAGSLGILAFVVHLVIRGRLKPRYALLWLVASSLLVLVSVWRDLIDLTGEAMAVDYKPALLFLAADMFLMLIVLHLSVAVSTLSDQVRSLAQELALLRGSANAEEIRTRAAPGAAAGGSARSP